MSENNTLSIMYCNVNSTTPRLIRVSKLPCTAGLYHATGYECSWGECTHSHLHSHAHSLFLTHTCMCAHARAHTNTHTHTHTHTYTHTRMHAYWYWHQCWNFKKPCMQFHIKFMLIQASLENMPLHESIS